MLIFVYHPIRYILSFAVVFCLLVVGATGSMAFYQAGKEAQRPSLESAKGPSQQGNEDLERKDSDEDDAEEVEQNAAAVEVDRSGASKENVSPLLSREDLSRFDIPIVFNDAVEYFIRTFTVEKRKVFITWLKRAKRYAPMIRGILREQGLPEDLVYLAMIESGFNPKAYSPMKACGPWQFIYETGERYGLRVSYWVDERRDPQKSTVAAARYLKDLFNQFGCWYLAAAGYNAGERRIERAIAKHETNDFWELRKYNTLPRETREYIPQLIAAAIIAKDPEKFGLTNIPFDAPVPFVLHKVPGGTPLSAIAKAAQSDVMTIRSLNPEVVRGITPPDAESYPLRLPDTAKKDVFNQKLKVILEDGSRVLGVTAYTVKRKDSVATITKRHRISPSDLMLVNACGGEFGVKPGSVVYIPRFERDGESRIADGEDTRSLSEKAPSMVAAKGSGKSVITKGYHLVRKGETLPDIARRYGLSVETLREINDLKNDNITPKTRIALMGETKKSAASRKDDAHADVLAHDQTIHIVKRGENLSDISQRYGTDVETLKKLNRLKTDRIVANMRLEVEGAAKAQELTAGKTPQARAVQARPVRFYHVVKKGENLTDISEKYSVKIPSLKKMNGLKRDDLRPGMRLRVASR